MKDTRNILVIDVGGTHIKLLATGQTQRHEIASGPTMTAGEMVRKVRSMAKDWDYAVISIGYPGPVVHGRPLREPYNLGGGWVRYDFQKAFGRPVKIMNDAAMQALGSYKKGHMLFLGLGTGLGSAMIADGVLQPMELAHLPYQHGKTYEDYLGLRGLKRLGRKKWERQVAKVVIDDRADRVDGQRPFVQQEFQHAKIREAESGFFNTSGCVPRHGAHRLHHYWRANALLLRQPGPQHPRAQRLACASAA
jgi:polyphosphate glucokinase